MQRNEGGHKFLENLALVKDAKVSLGNFLGTSTNLLIQVLSLLSPLQRVWNTQNVPHPPAREAWNLPALSSVADAAALVAHHGWTMSEDFPSKSTQALVVLPRSLGVEIIKVFRKRLTLISDFSLPFPGRNHIRSRGPRHRDWVGASAVAER
jgi:hypothetical protein